MKKAKNENQTTPTGVGLSELLSCPTDTERLDYLDALNKKLNDHYGNKYGWRLDMNFNRVSLTDSNIPPLTIREAIDEAIRRAK